MKKLLVWFAVIAMCFGCVYAEEMTIDLDTMTVEELEALKNKVSNAILSRSIEMIDGYIVVNDYDEYARNPEPHIHELIRFDGKVIQVVEGIENTIYRIAVDGDSNNVFYVLYSHEKDASRILEDDEVTVFGESDGLYSYASVLGGKITIPSCNATLITDKIIEASEYPATRQDPAPIGATIRYDGSSYYNSCVTDLTVTNVVRGDAANRLVRSWYSWNNDNDSTHDYIVVYVRTDAISSKKDEQASIDEYDFTFISGTGVQYEHTSAYKATPELVNLYPGATNEGVVVGLVAKDDNPLLVYLKSSDKPIWFDLNKRVPITLPDDYVFTVLEAGAKGEKVIELQSILIEMGYLSGTADGDFGGMTKSAVAAYQRDMGIEESGIANEETLRLLLTRTYPENK